MKFKNSDNSQYIGNIYIIHTQTIHNIYIGKYNIGSQVIHNTYDLPTDVKSNSLIK